MAALATPLDSFDAEQREFESLRLVEPRPRILSVSECQSDHSALRRIIDDTEWRLTTANSCRQAFEKLCSKTPLAVFTESALPDGTWKDVLAAIKHFEKPFPALVVTSSFASDRLWSEVLDLGGYDVLTKPLIHDEVRRVLESIWIGRPHGAPRARGAS
jgi:DNA-binding NtrC family response regulator